MSYTSRSGAMGSAEVVTGNIEFYTLFTTLDITRTGDYNDNSQKDFESVVQVIGLRAMPIMMNEPVAVTNGAGVTCSHLFRSNNFLFPFVVAIFFMLRLYFFLNYLLYLFRVI